MPTTPTYPGVYIEEIPSGVRTITGVATSITAFIGRAVRGEVDEPVTIHNFGDFERTFGGLHDDHPMSYAVRDFFLNGGSRAIIVRLFVSASGRAADEVAKAAEEAAGQAGASPQSVRDAARNKADEFDEDPEKTAADEVAKAAEEAAGQAGASPQSVRDAARNKADEVAQTHNGKAKWTSGQNFKVEAASPGKGGDNLKVKVDHERVTSGNFFNLTIREYSTDGSERRIVSEERIRNVAVQQDAGSRRVDRVLKQESQLVRIPLKNGDPDLPNITRPDETTAPPPPTDGGGGGTDGDGAASNGGGTAVMIKTQLARARDEEDAKFKDLSGGENSALLGENAENYTGSLDGKTGLFALEKADLFNLLCIPPDTRQGNTPNAVYQEAMEYCRDRRAILIVDPPYEWGTNEAKAASNASAGVDGLNLKGLPARNVALYFPRALQADPKREGQIDTFAPSGIIAGKIADTDAQRGVWKAPAGIDAALNGVQGLQVNLTDDENGLLNPLGINCLRNFPVFGNVVWGARTLRGADQLADEYKYLPVRRLALYLEESLYRGLKWVVFELNDEPLWSQIRLNVGAFMQNLFRQGAFQGTTPQKAYFVKCDSETTTQNDINLGIVNIVVGFAPLKPAEFVILKIQQMVGDIEV